MFFSQSTLVSLWYFGSVQILWLSQDTPAFSWDSNFQWLLQFCLGTLIFFAYSVFYWYSYFLQVHRFSPDTPVFFWYFSFLLVLQFPPGTPVFSWYYPCFPRYASFLLVPRFFSWYSCFLLVLWFSTGTLVFSATLTCP